MKTCPPSTNVLKSSSTQQAVPQVDFSELQSAFHRVLKAGLADLSEDGLDEETLNVSRPGSPEETIVKLEADDHRAMDFRNTLRTYVCIPRLCMMSSELVVLGGSAKSSGQRLGSTKSVNGFTGPSSTQTCLLSPSFQTRIVPYLTIQCNCWKNVLAKKYPKVHVRKLNR